MASSVSLRLACSAILPLLAATPAFAQDQVKLSINGSVRARAETIDGQFRPNTPESDSFLSFRTMVAAKIDIGPLTIGGEVVDARGYGESDKSSVRTNEINDLEPAQVYLAYRPAKGVQVTVGKFSMDIGSSRLVGRTDFPNGVPTYMGAKLEAQDKHKNALVLFWTRPFTALPDTPADIYDNKAQLDRATENIEFFGGDATLARLFGTTSLEAYGYRLIEHDRATHPTRNRRLVTFGARLRRAPAKAKFDYEVEGAVQRGLARATSSVSDVRDLRVRAGFVHGEAGYTIAGKWAPRISAMFDYASGETANPNSYTRFDTLYGARRADFGPLSLYGPFGRANIVSPGVRFEAKPSKRLDLMASVRGAWLASAIDSFASTSVIDKTGRSGPFGGAQLELRARRWLVPQKLRLELGAAYLAKGPFLRDAPNAPHTADTKFGHADLSFAF
ncbi:alginate export family protein [Sphingomonas sp. KR3-1]|uniref:alginate export family protein n=1 Tax=Sphingomonas sp. KR3-1 TaxID=3156611 RepID=UPI0032B5544C